ncbi:MAG: metallo-beta-lactamase superfamily protein, partial [Deltaproteobacteria bacterium]|nr:metallo-beta-lactamase superfamily protein [Deltaproteobacteria bacterium]
YQPGGRELRFVTSVAEQKQSNVQLRQGTTKQEYVKLRTARDAKLDMPGLILPAIQINIRAGEFPAPETNGTAYLKIPLNLF